LLVAVLFACVPDYVVNKDEYTNMIVAAVVVATAAATNRTK